MEIINCIIGCLALLISVIGFCLFDRKLKKQDIKINGYQLKKYKEEEIVNRKAQVRAVFKKSNGKAILEIYNSGKAVANNIRFDFLSDMKGIYVTNHIFPYEKLLPQESTSLILTLATIASDKIEVKLTWDDEFKKNNENTQILTLI